MTHPAKHVIFPHTSLKKKSDILPTNRWSSKFFDLNFWKFFLLLICSLEHGSCRTCQLKISFSCFELILEFIQNLTDKITIFSISTRFFKWEYSKILNLKIRLNLKIHGRDTFYLGGYQDWEIWINAIPLHKIWISLQLSIGVLRIRLVTWVYVGDVIRIHEEISEDFHIKNGHTLSFISFKRFVFSHF